MLHRVGGHATHSSNLVAPCTEMENDDTGRFLWIDPEKSREAFRGVRRSNTLCGKPSECPARLLLCADFGTAKCSEVREGAPPRRCARAS